MNWKVEHKPAPILKRAKHVNKFEVTIIGRLVDEAAYKPWPIVFSKDGVVIRVFGQNQTELNK